MGKRYIKVLSNPYNVKRETPGNRLKAGPTRWTSGGTGKVGRAYKKFRLLTCLAECIIFKSAFYILKNIFLFSIQG